MRNPSRSNIRAPLGVRDEASPSPQANTDAKRRRFLFALGAGGASAVAAGAGAPAAIACSDPPPADDSVARYSETDHVRDYYRTAKI
jgi:hypothetical protein